MIFKTKGRAGAGAGEEAGRSARCQRGGGQDGGGSTPPTPFWLPSFSFALSLRGTFSARLRASRSPCAVEGPSAHACSDASPVSVCGTCSRVRAFEDRGPLVVSFTPPPAPKKRRHLITDVNALAARRQQNKERGLRVFWAWGGTGVRPLPTKATWTWKSPRSTWAQLRRRQGRGSLQKPPPPPAILYTLS